MRSRSELFPLVVDGGAAAGAGDPPKSDMISSFAERAGAAEEDAEGVVSGALEPKMSASRSCVEGPLAAATLAVGGALSSPIKSTTVSLSVLVVPTERLSLT